MGLIFDTGVFIKAEREKRAELLLSAALGFARRDEGVREDYFPKR